MHILLDKNDKVSGYLYNNVILLPGLMVAGVLLAHCVFTQRGEVKGKFFKNALYNEAGELVAKEGPSESISINVDEAARIAREAWQVLSKTQNHVCPWVVATNKWSKTTLENFLLY